MNYFLPQEIFISRIKNAIKIATILCIFKEKNMDFQINQYIVILKICQENVPCNIVILLYSFLTYMFEPLKAIV